MNFTIDNFGTALKPLDLTLYAGVLLVVYVLFKEKIHELVDVIKEKWLSSNTSGTSDTDYIPIKVDVTTEEDVFFALIQSWKQTRDLAEEYGADKAVEIADQMFPYLVPNQEDNNEK